MSSYSCNCRLHVDEPRYISSAVGKSQLPPHLKSPKLLPIFISRLDSRSLRLHSSSSSEFSFQLRRRSFEGTISVPHSQRIQNKEYTSMSGRGLKAQVATSNDGVELELPEAASFAAITSPQGLVSVVGFGSLLSEKSSRQTFPNLINFRIGRLRGYRRVFAHHAPIFFERGIAKADTREMSSLSVEPVDGEAILVTVFEMTAEEVPAFIEREQEFRFMAVTPETLEGRPMATRAVVCSRYSDEEYRRIRLKGNAEEYHHRYGRWGIEKIWDDSILPCRPYLRHCVLAAMKLGPEAHDNFLDHTFLADRVTTIRQYLKENPDIMEELPPPSLADRYGG